MVSGQRDCGYARGQLIVVEQTEMQLVGLSQKIIFAQWQPERCAKNLIAQRTCAMILVGSKGYFPK